MKYSIAFRSVSWAGGVEYSYSGWVPGQNSSLTNKIRNRSYAVQGSGKGAAGVDFWKFVLRLKCFPRYTDLLMQLQ